MCTFNSSFISTLFTYLSPYSLVLQFFFFFFNDTATTEIYTLSLHDALPICGESFELEQVQLPWLEPWELRSEEHTSELQSRVDLVCRLLLEKKKKHKLYNVIRTKKKKITSKCTIYIDT